MEGVCVCVSVGKVVVREDHSEPTSCRMPKYAKFKLLPPSSLLWTLTVAHLWTLTIEHFSESYVCIVFIHLFFLTFFPFLFDHFQQHTIILLTLPTPHKHKHHHRQNTLSWTPLSSPASRPFLCFLWQELQKLSFFTISNSSTILPYAT